MNAEKKVPSYYQQEDDEPVAEYDPKKEEYIDTLVDVDLKNVDPKQLDKAYAAKLKRLQTQTQTKTKTTKVEITDKSRCSSSSSSSCFCCCS